MGEADPALKNKANIPQNESDDVMVSYKQILVMKVYLLNR